MSYDIREARPSDLSHLQRIESEADQLLLDLLHPDAWAPAMAGEDRGRQPGFLLVTGDTAEHEPPVGFVHVLEVDGLAHLEQLSVLPAHGRRGHGRALVTAALRETQRRGHDRLTVRTYAAVPWNEPFYRSCGFEPSEPDSPFLRGLVETEHRLGLDRWHPRVQLTARLPRGPGLPQPQA